MATAVNYDDKRFEEIETQQTKDLRETEAIYDNITKNSDSFYKKQTDAIGNWADKQTELQQAQTDFAIEKIEQSKDQAKKDYTKEQKGAYTDYQKATNEYGVNTEQLAAQGLNQTGYSESTRTNAYNTYQNRYVTARESYNQAILNYDNSIKEAQLANNAALATIAYESLQQQLELSLQGFQYKNTLLLQKLDSVNQTKDRYYQRWQNVQSQINTENAMAEQIRQYNESLAFQKEQAKQQQSNWEKEYSLAKKKSSSGSSGGSGGSAKLKDTSGGSAKLKDTNGDSSNSSNSSSGSSEKLSRGYTNVKKTALSLNLSAPGNKKSAVETYLAQAMANDSITKAEASKILEDLGY